MRVGLDGWVLGSQIGGDETYLRNVIRGLAAVEPDDDYTLFVSTHLPSDAIPGAQDMRRVWVQPRNPRIRLPLALPLALAQHRVEVLHVQYAAPLYPVPIVVAVHDIAYEHFPSFFPPSVVTGLRVLVPWTIRRAAFVLTLSEFSKQDIVRRYRVPPDKVVVTYLAADAMFRPLHDPTRLAEARIRYGTGEHFILSVGNLQPRKNLRALIDAYVRLRRADTTRARLVIVGRRVWSHDDIFQAARESGYEDELVFTDYVPDDDLVALYNAAELFVYPSLFEGFGLPPLEAMACGTPVVTSNTSALPETVGDAALTVDPHNVEALAVAMARALDDADLRARLSGDGLRRAQSFSWERTARTISAVYHRAGDKTGTQHS